MGRRSVVGVGRHGVVLQVRSRLRHRNERHADHAMSSMRRCMCSNVCRAPSSSSAMLCRLTTLGTKVPRSAPHHVSLSLDFSSGRNFLSRWPSTVAPQVCRLVHASDSPPADNADVPHVTTESQPSFKSADQSHVRRPHPRRPAMAAPSHDEGRRRVGQACELVSDASAGRGATRDRAGWVQPLKPMSTAVLDARASRGAQRRSSSRVSLLLLYY